MTTVVAAITISLDGYITGPNDGPGNGLGDGGERLHYWVFGGPWSYEAEPSGEATGVVTHRPEEAPSEGGFAFVDGLDEAIARARQAAGDKDISVGGGADVIRQALRAGYVDELAISIAPVILGGGKRLFDGFEQTLNLEHAALLQSPLATHITYRLVR